MIEKSSFHPFTDEEILYWDKFIFVSGWDHIDPDLFLRAIATIKLFRAERDAHRDDYHEAVELGHQYRNERDALKRRAGYMGYSDGPPGGTLYRG